MLVAFGVQIGLPFVLVLYRIDCCCNAVFVVGRVREGDTNTVTFDVEVKHDAF